MGSIVLTSFFGLSVCGFVLVQVLTTSSSSGAVVQRVYENSRLFLVVYFASWFLVVMRNVPGMYFARGMFTLGQLIGSLRGLFEAFAYMHLVKRRRSRGDGVQS